MMRDYLMDYHSFNIDRMGNNYTRKRMRNIFSDISIKNNNDLPMNEYPGLTKKRRFSYRINTKIIPASGEGYKVDNTMKSKTRLRFNSAPVFPNSKMDDDLLVGRAVAEAGEVYDNLSEMIDFVEGLSRVEHWSDGVKTRVIRRLKRIYAD